MTDLGVGRMAYGEAMSPAPTAPFEVIESFCQAKRSSETTVPGDDVLHVTPHFAGVIDGAGSWSGRLNGLTPGRFAALAVAEALNTLSPQADLPQAARHLSHSLREALEAARLEGELLRPPTCVAAIYSAARREIWLVGDCQALVGGQHHQRDLPTDRRAAAFRQAYLRALLLSGQTVAQLQASDPSWPVLKPLFEAAPAYQNHPSDTLGYGAFDGQEIPARHLHALPVSPGLQEIVLASDGYPALFPTLEASEAALWARASADPLMIADTPGCRAFPAGGGSFDERTYLRLRLS